MLASEIFAEPEYKSRYLYSISSAEEITECEKTFKDSQQEGCVGGTVYLNVDNLIKKRAGWLVIP